VQFHRIWNYSLDSGFESEAVFDAVQPKHYATVTYAGTLQIQSFSHSWLWEACHL
jgi:hypothetical protein